MSIYMATADDLAAEKRAAMSRLQWERVSRALTLRDVCAELGVAVSCLHYWEQGYTTPDPAMRDRLAAFYGVDAVAFGFRAWKAPRAA